MLLMLGMGYVHAQEAVPAAGGDAAGGNGSVSYSVGQVVYTTASGANGSSNQGVQQPYTLSTSSTGDELSGIQLSVFPNPTGDVLTLRLENSLSECRYELYDTHGKRVRSAAVTQTEMHIPVHDLPAASYVLNVFSEETDVQSFTIVKH